MPSPAQRLAELAVKVGAQVQCGQDVFVFAFDVEQAPVARAVAEEAYACGARFVSVQYWDQHVKHSRLRHAPADSLGFVPDWFEATVAECVARHAAVINVWGDPHRELLEDIPPDRASRDLMPSTPSYLEAAGRGDFAWTVVPGPCPGVARAVLGEPELDRLWEILKPMLRLDAADPVSAWGEHIARLRERAARLQVRRFGALRFRGGGTDLTVGLLPDARWLTAELETRWGARMVANLPTEEVFTTPDHRRTEGVVRITRPIQLFRGGRVEDLALRFEEGRAVSIDASRGADFARAEFGVDDGASRLGEVALVTGDSPVGRSGVVFGDGLFDENATCHMALGDGIAAALPGLPEDREAEPPPGFNRSAIHEDVMIGGPEVDVFGVEQDGTETPIILDDRWSLTTD